MAQVGVAGELQADAGLLGNGQAVGYVVEQDAGLGEVGVKAVERGETVFERYTVLAVILTPSWVAGIHRVKPLMYNIINVVTAVIWAGGIGVTAYLIGPSVVDAVDDFGTVTLVALGVGIVALIGEEIWRRRRKRARAAAG